MLFGRGVLPLERLSDLKEFLPDHRASFTIRGLRQHSVTSVFEREIHPTQLLAIHSCGQLSRAL